ncbi:MAG: AlpA family phage regulatory protein, partial [Planctomycetota bacterium]|nr:AlpA family phage regulatory protein [Planctomycetota bacterium]
MAQNDEATDDAAVMVDATQAAAMMGIHRATVFKLLSAGKFPRPVKLGRATRWVKDELLAWIAAKCPPLAKWEAMRNP